MHDTKTLKRRKLPCTCSLSSPVQGRAEAEGKGGVSLATSAKNICSVQKAHNLFNHVCDDVRSRIQKFCFEISLRFQRLYPLLSITELVVQGDNCMHKFHPFFWHKKAITNECWYPIVCPHFTNT